MTSKFRNANGNLLTRGLFYETSDTPETILYTLRDRAHEDYPSLHQLYLKEEDLTEYAVATKYFEGWGHWLDICATSWFAPYIERWREELELSIRAEALKAIIEEARAGEKNALTANRFLVSGGWRLPKDKTIIQNEEKRGRGRPSKQDIMNAADRTVRERDRLLADFDRILGTQPEKVQ